MKLKEFEGKELFKKVGITTSSGILIKKLTDLDSIDFNASYVAKVQTLQGGRGKKGGVKLVTNNTEAEDFVLTFLGKEFYGEIIQEILLDEKIEIIQEYYLGLLFDGTLRQPVLIVSSVGGVEIESSEELIRIPIDYTKGITDEVLLKVANYLGNQNSLNILDIQDVIKKLYTCFVEFDLRMVEINPLVLDSNHKLIAVDSVAVLDEDARYRWSKKIDFAERTGSRKATVRELAAREIDREDHRGVAGKTFLDLDGDIAILTSGGGASMTLVDTLVRMGGKPANFTEYSGNPPREKVEKLTRIVLDKPNLSGLLVAGVIANFTNIKETLQGVLNVLIEVRPDYPIVIRRAGPHDIEAKEMLMQAKKDYGLDIHYFDENLVLSKAAEVIVRLSKEYKLEKSKQENSNLVVGDLQ